MTKENEPKEVVSIVDSERIKSKSSMLLSVKTFFNSALFFFLYSLFGEKAVEIFNLYKVVSAEQYYKDGKSGTAFLQIDREGKIRQVKVMAYNPKTGKRLKENDEFLIYNIRTRRYEKSKPDTPASLFIGKQLMYDKEFVNKQCLFGTHLLDTFPDKPVAIVESEKTALICAIEMPEYVWLATGGQYGCKWTTPEVYNDLRGRKVTLFPDLKATEDWKIRAQDLVEGGIDVSVCEDLEEEATEEEREKGLDIADYILKNKQQENPNLFNIAIEKSTSVVPKAEVPAITNLLKGLKQSKTSQNTLNENTNFAKELIDIMPTDEDVAKLIKNKKQSQPDKTAEEPKLKELWEDEDAVSDIE